MCYFTHITDFNLLVCLNKTPIFVDLKKKMCPKISLNGLLCWYQNVYQISFAHNRQLNYLNISTTNLDRLAAQEDKIVAQVSTSPIRPVNSGGWGLGLGGMCISKLLWAKAQIQKVVHRLWVTGLKRSDSEEMSELGSIDNPVKFKDQDYDSLLQKCLKSALLFSDTVFAANQSSLGIPADPDPKKGVKWLRPKVTYHE